LEFKKKEWDDSIKDTETAKLEFAKASNDYKTSDEETLTARSNAAKAALKIKEEQDKLAKLLGGDAATT